MKDENKKLYEVTTYKIDNSYKVYSKLYVVASSITEAIKKALVDCKKDDPDEEFEVTELSKVAEAGRNLIV